MKTREYLPRFLSYDQVKQLIKSVSIGTSEGARNHAIIETLYATGIRVREIVALKMGDIDFLGEVVRVSERKGLNGIVPISSCALKAIQYYWKLQLRTTSNNNASVFTSKNGDPITSKEAIHIVENCARKAEIEGGVTPAILRNTFGVHMLQNGASPRDIQELMGIGKTRAETLFLASRQK